MFASVEELFVGGGGGAGRSLAAALEETVRYGLNLKKVKVVCATSVGSILALALVMRVPIREMFRLLGEMPVKNFQDWRFPSSLLNFPYTWGWCKGEAMPAYFRLFIKEWTGLEDPTFQELYDAGYKKELRVITTNLNKKNITVFSYKTAPHLKIADIVALSCAIPLVFPPRLIVSPQGKGEWHVDGGVLKNYPFGVGSDDSVSLQKQLGFTFVNSTRSDPFEEEEGTPMHSFIHYVKTWATMLLFQHPLTLPDFIKRRTVAIRVTHNPLVFTASREEQEALNQAGREGVRNLVAHLTKNNEERDREHFSGGPKPVLFSAQLVKGSKKIDIPTILKQKIIIPKMPKIFKMCKVPKVLAPIEIPAILKKRIDIRRLLVQRAVRL